MNQENVSLLGQDPMTKLRLDPKEVNKVSKRKGPYIVLENIIKIKTLNSMSVKPLERKKVSPALKFKLIRTKKT